MNLTKSQIKEAILGAENCRKEETPLCIFATFEPDMEMVELLLKGADIDKSFNNCPLGWVLQFCEPNLDKMLELLFKYKYYALHLTRKRDFEYLLIELSMVKEETALYVLNVMKRHHFKMSAEQYLMIQKEEFF